MQTIGGYELQNEIGRGSFATVYRATLARDAHRTATSACEVAIKSVARTKLKNKKLLDNLEIEISILKDLKHPHIVGLLDCQQNSSNFYLIMEYCSLGDLSFFIRKKAELQAHPVLRAVLERFPQEHGLHRVLCVSFVQQLASALKFLRAKNLVHRDIKPQNLLLSGPVSHQEFEENGVSGLCGLPVLKIADFGFARFLPSTSLAETLCGSPLYMAPEILNYQKYNAKADLWSVGAVLYEMCMGRPPYKASNHMELFNKIKRARNKVSFAYEVDEDIKELICGLLRFEPTERMGFGEFFTHRVVTMDWNDYQDDEWGSMMESRGRQVQESGMYVSQYVGGDRERLARPGKPVAELRVQQEAEQTVAETAPRVETPARTDAAQPRQIKKQDIIPLRKHSHDQLQPLTKLQEQTLPGSELKDYVVVEKKSVEVNALADEMAAGNGPLATRADIPLRRSSRGSSAGSSSRRPSDRRISFSISPTNALTKALGLASTRLFGQPAAPTSNVVKSFDPTDISNNIVLTSTAKALAGNSDFETQLETLSTKAHVVLLYADTKFQQLIPSPPAHSFNYADVAVVDDDDDADVFNELPPSETRLVADEALQLYIKALSLLAKAVTMTSNWWQSTEDRHCSARLNELVQWIRDKFNESLEKAEFARLKLQEAQKLAEGEPVYAERLIYERALEIARNAAKLEIQGEYLKNCELAYATSMWMLSALLEEDEPESTNLMIGSTAGFANAMDSTDRELVAKYMESITTRLRSLKRKIEE